jgi:type II secretory pathway component PulF
LINDEIFGSGGDMLPIASQISQTIRARLPLESGLRALAEQTRSRRARRALRDLSDSLEQGVPLDIAIEKSSPDLPPGDSTPSCSTASNRRNVPGR